MRALISLSHERTAEPVRGKNKIKRVNGLALVRDPAVIDSIILHQTACHFGAGKGQPRYRRALDVAAHCVAFNTGEVVLCTPLLWHVNHANGFNATSLGLEIEGKFPGSKFRKSKGFEDILTEDALWAACEGLSLLVKGGRAMGMPIKYILAHRQSSSTRRADPGWEIWDKVALKYGREQLGLIPRPDLVDRDGRPIPKEWDEAATALY